MYWKTGFKSKFKKHFETTREFLFFLSRRAQNDTIFRVAASLSYTSLIAVVPLFAIGLAIFSAFPVFDGVKEQVKEFLLRNFVPTIEQEVSQYFAEFIDAAAQLTTIGVVGIAITAILMLSTIENSLNFIFKVTRPRRLTTKITLYWTVITLGPLLLGTAFCPRLPVHIAEVHARRPGQHPAAAQQTPALADYDVSSGACLRFGSQQKGQNQQRRCRLLCRRHSVLRPASGIWLFYGQGSRLQNPLRRPCNSARFSHLDVSGLVSSHFRRRCYRRSGRIPPA